MKEEVERKKDEVKNMTFMMMNEEREPLGSGGMILGELEGEEPLDSAGEDDEEKRPTNGSIMQSRTNQSIMNMSQTNNINTTINFVKRIFDSIKFKENLSNR